MSRPRDPTSLVVDDDAGIRDLLERMLGARGYGVVPASDGDEALALIATVHPDVALLDVMMPGVDGLTLCRRLRESEEARSLPVILMTAASEVADLLRRSGADAVLRKPFDRAELLSWVRCLTEAMRARKNYEGVEAALVAMAAAVEARSLYAADHLWRVAGSSVQLAATIGLGGHLSGIIQKAALLHDVGQISVPESILRKPGPLTPAEFERVKRHPALGASMCRPLYHGPEIGAIVRGHHERWDGKGYPDGLAGEDIPSGARIVAVADAFDALTTDRPYRPAMTPGEALEILWFGADEQWDPHLVELVERSVQSGAAESQKVLAPASAA